MLLYVAVSKRWISIRFDAEFYYRHFYILMCRMSIRSEFPLRNLPGGGGRSNINQYDEERRNPGSEWRRNPGKEGRRVFVEPTVQNIISSTYSLYSNCYK